MTKTFKIFLICCGIAVVILSFGIFYLMPKEQPEKNAEVFGCEVRNQDLAEIFYSIVIYNSDVLQKIISASGRYGETEILVSNDATINEYLPNKTSADTDHTLEVSKVVYRKLLRPYFSNNDYADFPSRFYFLTTDLLKLEESDFLNKSWFAEYKKICQVVCKESDTSKYDVEKARIAWEDLIRVSPRSDDMTYSEYKATIAKLKQSNSDTPSTPTPPDTKVYSNTKNECGGIDDYTPTVPSVEIADD